MHRQRDVGHDGFRPSGGDLDEFSRFLDQLVADVIERGLLRGRDHFLIGKRGQGDRVPVDHTPAAIDEPLFVKIDEGALDSADIILVEGVAFPRPIAGAAEPLQLLDNNAAVFVLPFQDAPEKFLAPQIVSRLLFRPPDMFFHRGLRADSGMIRSRQPEHFLAQHARAPGEDVLDRVIQDVPEGEHAGDVRRRHDDGIRRFR